LLKLGATSDEIGKAMNIDSSTVRKLVPSSIAKAASINIKRNKDK